MTETKHMPWKIQSSGNPLKGWILDGTGKRLTRLIGASLAYAIVTAHNRELVYLEAMLAKAKEVK